MSGVHYDVSFWVLLKRYQWRYIQTAFRNQNAYIVICGMLKLINQHIIWLWSTTHGLNIQKCIFAGKFTKLIYFSAFLLCCHVYKYSWPTLFINISYPQNLKYVWWGYSITLTAAVAYRGGGLGLFNPPPKFRSFDKAEPNSQFRGKYICNNLRHPERLTKPNRIANWAEPPTRGLPPPRSPFSLPSTECVETPPPPTKKKSLGAPLSCSK
jgi:hypothetical protein